MYGYCASNQKRSVIVSTTRLATSTLPLSRAMRSQMSSSRLPPRARAETRSCAGILLRMEARQAATLYILGQLPGFLLQRAFRRGEEQGTRSPRGCCCLSPDPSIEHQFSPTDPQGSCRARHPCAGQPRGGSQRTFRCGGNDDPGSRLSAVCRFRGFENDGTAGLMNLRVLPFSGIGCQPGERRKHHAGSSCNRQDFVADKMESNAFRPGPIEIERGGSLQHILAQLIPRVAFGEDAFREAFRAISAAGLLAHVEHQLGHTSMIRQSS